MLGDGFGVMITVPALEAVMRRLDECYGGKIRCEGLECRVRGYKLKRFSEGWN